MSDYYWDSQIEYLQNTRWLYYNDDYLQFLVERVWKIDSTVHIVDYGCGYGYIGLKLLPLLPTGSTYTGIDKGTALIEQAQKLFSHLPNQTRFIVGDLEEVNVERRYDIAICHAFLLHMNQPLAILNKMINSVTSGGKVICFEPHWISNMASYYMDGMEQSSIVQLGILQKLFQQDHKNQRKDGNIGMKIPVLLSQLGVRNVECRISDRVNFLDQNMGAQQKEKLYSSLREEGIGGQPAERSDVINGLVERGITAEEAARQYEAELLLSQLFSESSWLTYAPSMRITFGTVQK
jgi:2-polyprenyl-3-methyl-5-hydroxy-6-metoxy-1,4-benzoquinol methylase